MSVKPILDRLRGLGIHLRLEGDALRLQAPEHVLTAELKEELRSRRQEIIEFLRNAQELSAPGAGLIPLESRGAEPPFFAMPGHNGDVFCFVPLARALGPGRPFYALQPPGVDDKAPPLTTIEDLAAFFAAAIRKQQPSGPVHLGGYCSGGLVAFEAACQLRERGEEVAALVLFGAPGPASYSATHRLSTPPVRAINRALRFVREFNSPLPGSEPPPDDPDQAIGVDEARLRVEAATVAATRKYSARIYPGDLTLFVPSDNPRANYCEQYDNWKEHIRDRFTRFDGPAECIHSRMLREPFVRTVAERLPGVLRG